MPREVKVGLLVLTALVVLTAGIFLIGEKENLFRRRNLYFIRFESASGLDPGNPVQLNGVTVGKVEEIVLPRRIDQRLLTVRVSIDRRYGERIRADSRAHIRTIGLLGDKFVDVSSGSVEAALIPPGGEIPAAPATHVEELLATGGDVAENIAAVAVSLRNILARLERGEGLFGELITETEVGRNVKTSTRDVVHSLKEILAKVERGEGTAGRLLTDDSLARNLEGLVGRMETVVAKVESGEGLLPMLLDDADARESVRSTLLRLNEAADELAELAGDLRGGEGLLGRLVGDPEYGRQLSEEIKAMVHNLNLVSEKLARGDGTLGSLLNDPQVYEAMNDILVGVNESKLLRWLIRNRQKAGIEKRFQEEQDRLPRQDGAAPPPPGPRP